MPPPIINPQPVNYGAQGSFAGDLLGSVPIVGGVLNGVSQIFTNARNRKFQREMYDKQRSDALADWAMQNEYNSPENQMQRLASAGLNPNLVYGHGAVATSSQAPRGASPSGVAGQAAQFNLGGVIPAIMLDVNTRLKEMQLENMKTQNLVLQQQGSNLSARTDLTRTQDQVAQFDLSMKKLLQGVTVARSEAELDNVLGRTDVMLQANERAALQNAQNLQLGVQRILQLKLSNAMNPLQREYLQAMIDAVGKSNELRQLDIDLKSKGFSWSDPYYFRVGAKIADDILRIDKGPITEGASGMLEAIKTLLHLQ